MERLSQWNTDSEFISISENGNLVALASAQKVEVRNIYTDASVATLNIKEKQVTAISFSNDEKLLAVGSRTFYTNADPTVQIWKLGENELIKTITIPNSLIANSLSISPDNSQIATGMFTGYTIVWDIQTGKDLLSFGGNQFNVRSVLFGPDGTSLASGGGNWLRDDPGEALIIYSIPSGQRKYILDANTQAVSMLAYTSDGHILASGSRDGKIVLWETETGNPILTLSVEERVDRLAFTTDGKILASGAGSSVQLWQVEKGVLLKTIEDSGGKVSSLSFSEDGTMLIIGTDDREISFWGPSASTSNNLTTNTSVPLLSEITDSEGVSMVLVPAGEFMMGSEDGDEDEKPVQEVYLDAFYIDKYEVTNSLYKVCVDSGVCVSPDLSKDFDGRKYYGDTRFDDYPVTYIDWNQADIYCPWREAKLPTESQWEKAARGTDGRTFPWGESIDCNLANYNPSCVGGMTRVGSYESGKSLYGIYDLAGNVWEWVADWYSPTSYQNFPISNPSGPENGEFRILRGGAWNGEMSKTRASYRFDLSSIYFIRVFDTPTSWPSWASPPSAENLAYYAGFRCAKETNP